MRICYFGTYESDYPRNSLFISGLREAGIEVFECHQPVWERLQDKSKIHGGFAAVRMLFNLLIAYVQLVIDYCCVPPHDLVLVGYVGQFDMLLAWFLTRLRAVPLAFNPLVSFYDTFCEDRDLVSARSLKGRLFWCVDYLACHVADLVILDTEQHASYFAKNFHLTDEKVCVVPVGADDQVFKMQPLPSKTESQSIEVLFVGKLIPLHGSETILRAAALLKGHNIHFTIVGSGQESPLVERLVKDLALKNVTLVKWVEYTSLHNYYAKADISLGVFGDSKKAQSVIPNKVFQGLAMARPVLSEDSPALRTELQVGEQIWVCRAADPDDLAQQILLLANNPDLRQQLSTQGYTVFQREYTRDAIGRKIVICLSKIIPSLGDQARMDWGAQPEFYGPRHRFREDQLFKGLQRMLLDGEVILDAACGAGTFVRRLRAKGYPAMGTDLSMKFLTYLRKQCSAPAWLCQSNIQHLPFKSSGLDAIILAEVLEHLEEKEVVQTLRAAYRALRPEGICAISVPANPNLWDWHDDWAGHLRRYRLEELQQILVSCGFSVVRGHYFGFPFVYLFHRYVYLPTYRRRLLKVSPEHVVAPAQKWWWPLVNGFLLLLFKADTFFNHLPLGLGLIVFARKPGSISGKGGYET
jgi:glycosyltransferase involved in cell wall biosynthesis/SAM-dependent methyltransferase